MRTITLLSVGGTAKVVRFNWPKYAAVVAILVAALVGTVAGIPPLIDVVLWSVGLAGLVWSLTSLVATWWVYDHRRVYDRVAVDLDDVGDWASVHAGFDDATENLVRVVGREPQAAMELSMHASRSLRRARGSEPRAAIAGAADSLPMPSSSLDSIFVTFAMHEIRDRADQRALFAQLHRVLRPGGRLVVTEHLRDVANFVVYGPGAFHFQSGSTWVARAEQVGFTIDRDEAITPFVRRMVWRR